MRPERHMLPKAPWPTACAALDARNRPRPTGTPGLGRRLVAGLHHDGVGLARVLRDVRVHAADDVRPDRPAKTPGSGTGRARRAPSAPWTVTKGLVSAIVSAGGGA